MTRKYAKLTKPNWDNRTIYAISDVHGHPNHLQVMLDHIHNHDDNPGIVFLGDLINRGNDGAMVMEMVANTIEKHDEAYFIMGNHDRDFLKFIDFGLMNMDIETVESYTGEPIDFNRKYMPEDLNIPKSHVDLLRNASNIVHYGKYIFSHGGWDPEKPLDKQNVKELTTGCVNMWEYKGRSKYTSIIGHHGVCYPAIFPHSICIDVVRYPHEHLITMAVINGDDIQYLQVQDDMQIREVFVKKWGLNP